METKMFNVFRRIPPRILNMLPIIILAIMVLIHIHNVVSLEIALEKDAMKRNDLGYVSDEIWYVCSSRNILYKIFGIQPWTSCGECYNMILDRELPDKLLDSILKQCNSVLLRRVVEEKDGRKYVIYYIKVTNSSSINDVVSRIESLGYKVKCVVRGWIYGKAMDIHEYLNLEHPPLVKYLIALSILFGGDQPFQWRLPSIIASTVTIILSYVITYMILRERFGIISKYYALLPPAFLVIDPVHKYLGTLAFLDTMTGSLSLLTLLIYIRFKKTIYTVIAANIAALAKFSGLFIGGISFLERFFEERGLRRLLSSMIYVASLYILVFMILQTVASIPFIMHLGFDSWFSQSITGAFKWHTSVKCTEAGCPPASSPLDWLLGRNCFVLYYWAEGTAMVAGGKPILYLVSVGLAIALIPLAILDKWYRISWMALASVYGGYVILWLIGGRTQYSFYLVHIIPFFYIHIAVALAYIFWDQTYIMYKDFLRRALKALKSRRVYGFEEAQRLIGYGMILASVILSSLIHAPWSSPRIYSDIVSTYETIYISRIGWHGSITDYGIPYIDYDFMQPPGSALLFSIASLPKAFLGYDKVLGIDKGYYGYYVLSSLIILLAAIVIYEELVYWCRRLNSRTPAYIIAALPSVIIYGVYDWTIVAVALLLRGIRSFKEGFINRSALYVTLASMINPLILISIPAIAILAGSRNLAIRFMTVSLIMLGLLISWPIIGYGSASRAFDKILGIRIEGSPWLLVSGIISPSDIVAISIAITIVAVFVIALSRIQIDGYETIYPKLAIAISVAMLVFPMYKPQYNLLPCILLTPLVEPMLAPALFLQDAINSMVILTWFSVDNPLNPLSIPQIVGCIRWILLFIIILYHAFRYLSLKGSIGK